jgi:hypothetical protein
LKLEHENRSETQLKIRMFLVNSGVAPPPAYDSLPDPTTQALAEESVQDPPEYRPDIPMFVRSNSVVSQSEPPAPTIATVWMQRPQPVQNCMPGFEFLAHLNKITAHQNFNRLPASINLTLNKTFYRFQSIFHLLFSSL